MNELLSIVVNYKTEAMLYKFLESYRRYVDQENRILAVVDVESAGGLEETLKLMPVDYWITFEDNVGYARAVNQSIASLSDLEFRNIAIFNADTEFVNSSCVESCIDLLDSNEDVGIVGPMQYTTSGKITHAGIFGDNSHPQHAGWMSLDHTPYSEIRDAVTVSGSAYFVKRSAWDELGNDPEYRALYPEAAGPFLETRLYHEETFCSYFARHRGYRVLYNGEAEMIHEHDASPGNDKDMKMKESKEMFVTACDALGMEHN